MIPDFLSQLMELFGANKMMRLTGATMYIYMLFLYHTCFISNYLPLQLTIKLVYTCMYM